MSSELPGIPPEPAEEQTTGASRRWPALSTKTKVILGVSTAVVVVVGYFILQRFLPEWWARSMGAQIDGSFTSGTMWGLMFGIVGSALPLILGLLAFFTLHVGPKHLLSWLLGVIALALLIPNLLTLAVVIGDGSGARIGRRNFDVYAPSFRGSTLIGVIIGIVIGVAADFYLLGRRRSKAKLARKA